MSIAIPNLLNNLSSTIGTYQDITAIYNKIDNQGYLERFALLLQELFEEEHKFTINGKSEIQEFKNEQELEEKIRQIFCIKILIAQYLIEQTHFTVIIELVKFGQENDQVNDNFIEEQYELNANIFKRNLSVILQILIEDSSQNQITKLKEEFSKGAIETRVKPHSQQASSRRNKIDGQEVIPEAEEGNVALPETDDQDTAEQEDNYESQTHDLPEIREEKSENENKTPSSARRLTHNVQEKEEQEQPIAPQQNVITEQSASKRLFTEDEQKPVNLSAPFSTEPDVLKPQSGENLEMTLNGVLNQDTEPAAQQIDQSEPIEQPEQQIEYRQQQFQQQHQQQQQHLQQQQQQHQFQQQQPVSLSDQQVTAMLIERQKMQHERQFQLSDQFIKQPNNQQQEQIKYINQTNYQQAYETIKRSPKGEREPINFINVPATSQFLSDRVKYKQSSKPHSYQQSQRNSRYNSNQLTERQQNQQDSPHQHYSSHQSLSTYNTSSSSGFRGGRQGRTNSGERYTIQKQRLNQSSGFDSGRKQYVNDQSLMSQTMQSPPSKFRISRASQSPGNHSISKGSLYSNNGVPDPSILDSDFSYVKGQAFSRSRRKLHDDPRIVPGPGHYLNDENLQVVERRSPGGSFGKCEKKTIFHIKPKTPGYVYYPQYNQVSK